MSSPAGTAPLLVLEQRGAGELDLGLGQIGVGNGIGETELDEGDRGCRRGRLGVELEGAAGASIWPVTSLDAG